MMDLNIQKNITQNQSTFKKNGKNNISFTNESVVAATAKLLTTPLTNSIVTINTQDIWNYTLVDVASMVAPRTAIDAYRNKFAAIETFFREIAGTIFNCLSPGLIAFGVAATYNKLSNKKVDIKPNLWADSKTVDLLGKVWNRTNDASPEEMEKSIRRTKEILSNKTGKSLETDIKEGLKEFWDADKKCITPKGRTRVYLDTIFGLRELKGRYQGEKNIKLTLKGLVGDNWIDSSSERDIRRAIKILEHSINNGYEDKKYSEKAIKVANKLISRALKGARSNIKIALDEKTSITATSEDIVKNIHNLGKHVFIKYGIKDSAKEAMTKITKMNGTMAGISLGIIATIDFSTQYLNRYLTKKRTGKDGFVGYSDYAQGIKKSPAFGQNDPKKKKSALFAKKMLALAGLGALAIGSMRMGGGSILEKLQFTKAFPNVNQIRAVYTATLAGRFLASRDENELRESCTRDYLGFLNWLVLGGLVSKLTAQAFDKKRKIFFNDAKKLEPNTNLITKIMHWINDVSLKSHHEVASDVANTFKNSSIDEIKKVTENRIKILNKSSIAGMAYSCVMLGIAIPLINKTITEKRRKSELAANAGNIIQNTQVPVISQSSLERINKINNNKELYASLIKKAS